MDKSEAREKYYESMIKTADAVTDLGIAIEDDALRTAAGIMIVLATSIQEIDQYGNSETLDALAELCSNLCDKGIERYGGK